MRRASVSLLLFALLPAAARAQAPAERTALEAFRDSLSAASTPAAVDSLVGRRNGSPALHHLRVGFGALRRAELTEGRGALDAAVTTFEEAIRRERDWPYGWFGLGLAKLGLHRGAYPPKGSTYHLVGISNHTAFVQSMERALARDAAFPPLLRLLADMLAAQGDREQPAAFLAALERALATEPHDPRPALVLARAARTTGRHDSALALIDLYRARGGDAGVAALERARMLQAVGRGDDAVRSHRDGLARPSAEARALYRRDLAWIATAEELSELDALPGDSLLPWSDRFWARREAEALRAPDTRLAEHLRRWNHVHARFRVPNPERRTQFERVRMNLVGDCMPPARTLDQLAFIDNTRIDDDRRRERLLDHRAVVYMRHGEPARRIATINGVVSDASAAQATAAGVDRNRDSDEGARPDEPADGEQGAGAKPAERPGARRGSGGQLFSTGGSTLSPAASEPLPPVMGIDDEPTSESWLYWFDGEPRLFHFRGSGALGKGPTTLDADVPLNEEILRTLGRIDGRYNRLAHMVVAGSRAFQNISLRCHPSGKQLVEDQHRDLRTVVATDSWTPIHETPLEPVVQTFAVGRPERGTGRLLLVYAARGERLRPDAARAADGRLTYTLLVRATAIDSATGAVRRLDTVRTVVAADTLREGQHLGGVVELALPAGRWEVRALVEQPAGAGSAFELPTPAYLQAGGLALSDLVPGRAGAGLVWAAPDGPVALNPLDTFPRGTPMDLYYELDGLRPGADYRTTIEVRRTGAKDARGGVRLAFSDVAGTASARVRRTIGLQQLRRGRYVLVVSIEERGTGRLVTRERPITVIDR